MDFETATGLPPGVVVSPSFSCYHEQLWAIAEGSRKVKSNKDIRRLPDTDLGQGDLTNMVNMVELEFVAGMEKELNNGDSEQEGLDRKANPRPFDVFLMESPSGRLSWAHRRLALCMPLKALKKRKDPEDNTPTMMWYVGKEFLPLQPKIHIRPVASLSGAARILAALGEYPLPDSLMENAMNRSMLVQAAPCEDAITCGVRPDSITLMNESQVQAVATIVSPLFRRGFFAIQGPPGCGKTTTMVGMISSIRESVIVTAPSNAAVANIALKLYGTRRYHIHDICVYGENCDDSVRFLNPKHRSAEYNEFCNNYDKEKDSKAKQDKVVNAFGQWLHLEDDEISIQSLAALCPQADNGEYLGTFNHLLSRARVILCTLNTAGSPMLRWSVRGNGFTTLMLDEAGQCTEAEFFIATTFPDIERIIVVGDPKQLPSTVIDPVCQQAGYGRSWLGQVFDKYPERVHLLDTQYRMDPEILDFPNARFYDGRIRSGVCVFGRQPYVARPFRFVDTQKRGQEVRDGFSWKNPYEAMVIKSILRTDEDIVRIQRESSARTIIITPYKAQAKLLKDELTKLKGLGAYDVSTVDSFQGQEGDIVILSTVRTFRVGFTDNGERLNVALTRAKRVLRVVGDLAFFHSLHPSLSTLRALAVHAEAGHHVEKSKLKADFWSHPNWDVVTFWKPRFTARFHNCIRKMSDKERNACFHTLLAVATPRLQDLDVRPMRRSSASWQSSGLQGLGQSIRVVWIAREKFVVEAHFAGNRSECIKFMQARPPIGASIVTSDLLGLEIEDDSYSNLSDKQPLICWPITNNMQNFMSRPEVEHMPDGNFCLDPHQEGIALSPPPLLIESRSGTGKTNVLFQHAAFYQRTDEQRPACFVTVSPRLRNLLERRYEEVNLIENDRLPKILFFSFLQLLSQLINERRIPDFQKRTSCTFFGYCSTRKSYAGLSVDPNLAENEIGGVIMGSLDAAIQRSRLSRNQYLSTKRSNVAAKTQEDIDTRNLIYDEYERYTAWKRAGNFFDQSDVVLRLLDEDIGQPFGSAYLDEVQDLSYASILLICKIAGGDYADWVCAGDTAQMISPGCSFTFDGLKQTLLALKEGIEPRLANVSHLLVNYRTTKDVLLVGNEILRVAKLYFPGAIEYALPETAMKDLGLKVVLLDWRCAWHTKVSFGNNQAFIFSSMNGDESSSKQISDACSWLGDHPFILTSLESKGLEFDDVVVAFDLDRKVWDVKCRRVASLRMLRELYVAVTRAKRRVVILVKSSDIAMTSFFTGLDCDLCFGEVEYILKEFDCDTLPEAWFAQGERLFDDQQFKLAASCFSAAKSYGWSNWALGKFWDFGGNKKRAVEFYRQATTCFHADADYKRILEIMRTIKDIPPWDEKDDPLLQEAMQQMPTFFSKRERVELLLIRKRWDDITSKDLTDPSTSVLFFGYRESPELKVIVRCASDDERSEIGGCLPGLLGDYHFDRNEFCQSVQYFLNDNDIDRATKSSEAAIRAAKARQQQDQVLSQEEAVQLVGYWSHQPELKNRVPKTSPTWLLLQLYAAPREAAAQIARDCISNLGRNAVIHAVAHARLSRLVLYEFDRKEFALEVSDDLENFLGTKLIEAIDWFVHRKDKHNATEFARKHLKSWTDDELLYQIAKTHRLRPVGIYEELNRRKLLVEAVCRVFLPKEDGDIAAGIDAGCTALGSNKAAITAKGILKKLVLDNKFDKSAPFSKHHVSNLSMFLDLCRDPEGASLQFGNRCFLALKKEIILDAVHFGGPYQQDVISILQAFSNKDFKSVRPFDVLLSFRAKGNHRSAVWYAAFVLSRWSDSELLDIVENKDYIPEGIVDELTKRELFMEAARVAIKLGDLDAAARISIAVVQSTTCSEENVWQSFKIWCDVVDREHCQVKLLHHFPSWLLLTSRDPKVLQKDEFRCLLLKFGPTVARFASCMYNGRNEEFHDALLLRILCFHKELKARTTKLMIDARQPKPAPAKTASSAASQVRSEPDQSISCCVEAKGRATDTTLVHRSDVVEVGVQKPKRTGKQKGRKGKRK